MPELDEALRRRSIAARTMQDALGEWREQEQQRLIRMVAQCRPELSDLLDARAQVIAYFKLINALDRVHRAGIDDND